MARKVAAVVFSLGCIHASASHALGLGELTLESFLNEPLKAHVDLLNTDGLHADQIRIRLATREDFERMGVDRAYFLTSITFEVTQDDNGHPVIVMSSDDPVLEPYLDFIVEARWPSGRLLREYTVLVDPPLFDESTPVVSASRRVAEEEGLPEPADSGKKSQAPAATSGTRVDVRNKSDLGPGEMPQRGFNAETSDSPVSGSRYMIHRDDTLWEIADAAKPTGASVHQTMLDIQRLNPDAFIEGNINRIKAGYIIYLPQEGDISSDDLAAALAEVRQQNEDWEAGRASKPIASSGPSLRISADPVEDEADSAAAESYEPGRAAAQEELARAEREQEELSGQVVAMEQQIDTLQRIVSLKDDQIAALQDALAEAGAEDPTADMDEATAAMTEPETGAPGAQDMDLDAAGDDVAMEMEAPAGEAAEASAETEAVAPAVAEVERDKPAAPQPATPSPEEGGMMSYLLYGLGALVLALLAFLFVRRGKSEAETTTSAAVSDDVFATVELKEQKVEAQPEPEFQAPLEEPEEPEEPEEEPGRDNRGYGEHKHDEYASDVDAGDALAEADIYIAYGRYPQAIDLLKNAIATEPANPAYRLKLLEMHLQMGDRELAENELRELEAIGDAGSLEQARSLMGGSGPSEPPAGLGEDVGAALESDFAGLEIEEDLDSTEVLEDDLDLSADFTDSTLPSDDDDEDLVIAAEANGMSTKLDLARAYLDMGDEDGARQILEEVMAEGSQEHKSEAEVLLERIG